MHTLSELKLKIAYNADTGEFTWLHDLSNRVKAGSAAGSLNDKNYRIIRLEGERYAAHRIAWLLSFGEWPKDTIDHINGDPSDNRLCNLREATLKQNLLNRRGRNSIPGLKGVSMGRNGRFRAQITFEGRQKYLGEFDSAETAHSAYIDAAKRIHGEFARFS